MPDASSEPPNPTAAGKTEILRARYQRAQSEAPIRLDPLEMVSIAAGVGFVFALLLRR
jgi:ElaB/YqjD/DUF883 family membrane-anchored ribosome-binding protein